MKKVVRQKTTENTPKRKDADSAFLKRKMILEEISSDALAYLGDSVIELLVREHLVKSGISGAAHLNSEALKYVKASSQAKAMRNILPLLDEHEEQIYKRGRNKQGGNIPKSATVSEYRCATGMEVLFGYLYLAEQKERIEELFFEAFFPDRQQ